MFLSLTLIYHNVLDIYWRVVYDVDLWIYNHLLLGATRIVSDWLLARGTLIWTYTGPLSYLVEIKSENKQTKCVCLLSRLSVQWSQWGINVKKILTSIQCSQTRFIVFYDAASHCLNSACKQNKINYYIIALQQDWLASCISSEYRHIYYVQKNRSPFETVPCCLLFWSLAFQTAVALVTFDEYVTFLIPDVWFVIQWANFGHFTVTGPP